MSGINEIFTCECGNQTWILYHSDEIECTKCKNKYSLLIPTIASEFNSNTAGYNITPGKEIKQDETNRV